MLRQYLLMTLDPVHIGTGGYRLGRVDNSIVREPGTKIPKIPGTSLNGAIRTYAAYVYEKVPCAGQSGHCGRSSCPVCYTFGSISGEGENQQARAGTVNIFDAQILFFPVWSMMGPVWITTKNILKRVGWNLKGDTFDLKEEQFIATFKREKALNFGWLMLEPVNNNQTISISPDENNAYDEYEVIKDRIAVVSDHIFSRIVNDNLEVRTSVSINPETGAAESGALFTYEAIPRSTFLILDVVEDDFGNSFPSLSFLTDEIKKLKDKGEENLTEKEKKKLQEMEEAKKKLESSSVKDDWTTPTKVFETGLSNIEMFGVGGMGTRGFGRIRWVKGTDVQNGKTANTQEESKNVK